MEVSVCKEVTLIGGGCSGETDQVSLSSAQLAASRLSLVDVRLGQVEETPALT